MTNGLAKLFNDYSANPYVSTNLVINIKNCNKFVKNLKLDNVNFIAERKINAITVLPRYYSPRHNLLLVII